MAEQRLLGRGAAPGLVAGRVSVLQTVRVQPRPIGTPEEERASMLAALEQAIAETEDRAAQAIGDAADMLEFQVAMLTDDELTRPVFEAITSGLSAIFAWEAAIAAEATAYTSDGNAVLAARSADLDDIRDRVLDYLSPGSRIAPPPPGAIIAAADLSLSRFLDADWSQGGAIILTEGSEASHVAMLARARNVPMVVGLGGSAAALSGRHAIVDATAGELVLDPTETTLQAFTVKLGHHAAAAARANTFRNRPAITADGSRISVCVNISDLQELDDLDPACCDGIGLVRTELLFHDPVALFDEERQYAAYRRLLEWAGPRPVTIRTLDAGGDKPIAGITPSGESNPFLGLRGLRLSLQSTEVFILQLRALARAAIHGNLRVMVPMVTVPAELSETRSLLEAVLDQLGEEGLPCARPLLGIMVEVPAAAISIGRFDAEFFSIGSNDLTQYVTAAARDIGAVAALADPLNPAVLTLIENVARHGSAAGRDVSLCGDAAADPRCIEPLLRAGLRSLSVSPASLGPAKEAIAATDLR